MRLETREVGNDREEKNRELGERTQSERDGRASNQESR